ncbi:LysR family transcriptional regulator [Pseudomonas lurida]|jgi:DNA-binding transcriptional LysR family regulator|uniref:LysR family transcriptional regulator n=1 Tax=Pseudomonas lurida TaxID=244566 RepID=UPI00083E1A26|nr:LysR family transcriptional regulator [Pseudomonas lurida]VVM46926.1 HTH-type transcriptional regulator DmlR [Pseudomonas fluorescens]AOE79649.1 LysR family transcriptional regulator [Pseudomonas lurida]MBC3242843.1 LysR family transcriptional regulator [Pseudomonas lurida]MBD8666218.1 LysR family transcriptional regulator [Pseudomonas lurida]UZQ74944.1 LysR family transcriptional regulator [Pseudomonas lurida]
MDLFNGMRVFAQVVDSGSFAAAAEVLNLSGAQVSRLVADLEHHLQARLLQRTTRRLSLTESGERFLLRCRGILDDVRDASAEASGAHLNPRGHLRVHCMSGLGVLITPLIARYSELHPDVSLELTLSQHTPDPLEEGHDVVISIAHALPDSALVSQTIGQLFSVPCAAPGYLAKHGVPEHPRQLLEHRRLHLQDFQEDEWLFQDEAGAISIPPGTTFRTNVADAMVKATQEGMGVSLLPFFSAYPALKDGSLVRLLPEYRLRERTIFAVYPSRRFLDAKVRTWVVFLQERLPVVLGGCVGVDN